MSSTTGIKTRAASEDGKLSTGVFGEVSISDKVDYGVFNCALGQTWHIQTNILPAIL